jgi:trans-2,3-dihydro-3-hydroxyanthranilate isomerase
MSNLQRNNPEQGVPLDLTRFDLIPLEFVWLDVFTQAKFGGNPLAVVFLEDAKLSDTHLQQIAREFNLSETTFVSAPVNPAHSARVRIFTPRRELPFAGHPTLGTAFAIAQRYGKHYALEDRLILEEGVGPVTVQRLSDGSWELETAQQPSFEALPLPVAELADLLGLRAEDIGAEELPDAEIVSCGVPYALIPIRSLAAIQRARFAWPLDHPRFEAYPALREPYLVCAETVNPAMDYHVRLFAPEAGIAEDPATGSAAAVLAASLGKYQGPGSWRLEQGLEMHRPSQLRIRHQAGRIFVAGHVVPVAQGRFMR